MTKQPSLKTIKSNTTKTHKLLRKQLTDYNISQIGRYTKKQIAFGYYVGKKLVAGLYAHDSLGVLFIELLWISKNYRHKNLGSKLLAKAEAYATKNNILYVKLTSGSFQAPKFYLKHGYKQFAKLPLKIGKQKYHDYYFIKYL